MTKIPNKTGMTIGGTNHEDMAHTSCTVRREPWSLSVADAHQRGRR